MLKKVLIVINKPLLVFFILVQSVLPLHGNSKNIKSSKNSDFFPIAVWLQSPFRAQEYKANGINLFIGVHNGLTQEKMNDFKEANMKFICSQNEFAQNHLDEPLIYAWMHGDEPDNAQWNSTAGKYDPCIDPEIIINDYEKIKLIDSTRPVYLNLGRGVAFTDWIGRGTCTGDTNMYKVSNNGYLKGCDIASFDIYPVNSSEEEVEDSLWYVAKGINNLEKWSDNKKPVWCWIETTRISESSDRKPTPEEVKSEVWMAIIHGAKGFGYFCHSFYPSFKEDALLQDQEMIRAVKKINLQVTSLAEVLNSPDTLGIATVSSSNPTVPVHLMAKNYKDANYLFAVAMRPGATEATFEIKDGTKVEVVNENREITVVNGKFTDEFSNYGVHIYKYSATSTNAESPESKPVLNPIIFPNPTSGKLTIEFPGTYSGKVTISDDTGKKVLEKELSSQKSYFDLSGEKAGIYFIQIESETNSWHKIIKL